MRKTVPRTTRRPLGSQNAKKLKKNSVLTQFNQIIKIFSNEDINVGVELTIFLTSDSKNVEIRELSCT